MLVVLCFCSWLLLLNIILRLGSLEAIYFVCAFASPDGHVECFVCDRLHIADCAPRFRELVPQTQESSAYCLWAVCFSWNRGQHCGGVCVGILYIVEGSGALLRIQLYGCDKVRGLLNLSTVSFKTRLIKNDF